MNKTTNQSRKAIAASLISCIIYGFSFLFSRIALMHTSGDMLLAIRFTVSMLIMLLLTVFGAARINLRGKPIGRFLLLGIFQPVLYFIAETYGILYTSSSFSGLMISLIPIMTTLMSAVFLGEHVSVRTLGWIMCSVIGVAVISSAQTSSGTIQLKGIIWLVIAVAAASAFYIISKSGADAFTPFERTFIMMVTGFVFFTGKAIVVMGSDFAPMLREAISDKYVLICVAYLAALSSVVAFMMQNYAITYLDLATTTVFENIIPVISVAAGVLLLGESFSVLQLVGIVLIFLGVWKVTTAPGR